MTIMFYMVMLLCMINLFRLTAYLIGSDIYSMKLARTKGNKKRWHLPTISVLVPAHNEEHTIERCMDSVYNSDYPQGKLEMIVCNDGSTDRTRKIVEAYKRTHRNGCKIRLINRPNKGKAATLNYALRRSARHQLIMCLESDSCLDPGALRNAAQYFRDRDVVALSSNVNIIEDSSLITLLQRLEYLVCYQMKKGQAQFGVEYIVGGIGSIFRRSNLKKVSYYDTNTMTEDIDLTLKILVNKSRQQKIAFAADSIVYTEPAHSLKELMKQRFRWKFGRNQTYFKHLAYFFSKEHRHNKRLTWFMLPFSLLQDLFFLLEPIIILYFAYIIIYYHDYTTLISAVVVLSVYLTFNIWSTSHLRLYDKLRLSIFAPVAYFLMYILSFAEYYALIKSLIDLPTLRQSIFQKHITWNSPTRKKVLN